MVIGIFTVTVISLMLLFAFLNAGWLSRIISPERRKAFRLAYAVLTLLAVAAYAGMRFTGQFDWLASLAGIFYFGSFWAMLQLLLLLAWPVSKILAMLQRFLHGKAPATIITGQKGMTRRSFLTQAAFFPPAAMTGINTVGFLDAELGTVVRRMDMVYAELSQSLHGLKIAHLTDVHLGPYVSVTDLQKMLALMQKEAPDIVAITGDFVDDLTMLPAIQKVIQPFVASVPLGVWFCMGNHEYIRGAIPIRKMLNNSGVQILDNQNRQIAYNGGSFYIAGVDYPMGARMKTRPEDVEDNLNAACKGIISDSFTVMLSHHPDFLAGAFARKVGLTLAGHTHGAQVGWGARSAFEFLYPYMRGIYQSAGSIGYVSSGAGHWLPFRLNCPPEVSMITLKRTKMV